MVATVQRRTQALSQSLFASMIRARSSELFGLFSIFGNSAQY
jgi:MFS-type transporter involved in bile tolerance (Atg22 family)